MLVRKKKSRDLAAGINSGGNLLPVIVLSCLTFGFLSSTHAVANESSFYKLSVAFANGVLSGRNEKKCADGEVKRLKLSATTHLVGDFEGKKFSDATLKKAQEQGVRAGQDQVVCEPSTVMVLHNFMEEKARNKGVPLTAVFKEMKQLYETK